MFDQKNIQVTRIEKREIELTGFEVAELLRRAGIPLPTDTEVTFTVPRGGDYSGTIIEIDKSTPVRVRWTIRTTEKGDG